MRTCNIFEQSCTWNDIYYFKIGDQILARWRDGLQYPAIIESKNENGTWNIKWKDSDPELRYYHTSQSLQHDFKFIYEPGRLVLAKWKDGKNYFAVLKKQNAEGNWEITWHDGEHRLRFNRSETDLLPTKKSPMVNIKIEQT